MTGEEEPGSRDELLPRADRLRKSGDYRRCYREGRRCSGRFLRLFVHPNEEGHPRVGVTASRKVGGSVVRHRVKRRLREIYRRWPRRHELPPLDIVIHVHPTAALTPFSHLEEDLVRLLSELVQGGRR